MLVELTVNTQDSDVYVDASTLTATVTGVTGGNFEAVDYSEATTTINITDTIDTTTVSISGTDVNEDEASATFTVTLSNPTDVGSPATVVVNVGGTDYTVTIPAEQSSANFTVNTQDSDVYVDASTLTATVTGVTGGNFEAVDYSEATTTINITDTIDTTTVSISGTDVNEDEASATFTVTLSNPTDVGSPATVVVNVGGTDYTVTIPAEQSSANFTVNTQDSDVYVDASTLTATVTGVTGGNFEAVDYSEATTTINITDTIDTTTVSISGTDVNEDEASATFTVTLSNPTDVGSPATVVVNVGGTDYTVTIPAEQSSANFTVNTQDSDVYVDASTLTATVTGVTGGNFEAVDYSEATTTINITDTIDTTTVSISGTDVNEDEASATFTVTLSNPTDVGSPATVVVNVGGTDYTVTIPAEQSSANFTVNTQDSDVYVDASTLTATVTGVTGGNFEAVDYSEATTTINITDTIDTTTVSISGTDVNEDEASATFTVTLSNPTDVGSPATVVVNVGGTDYTVTIPAEQSSANFTVNTQDSDVYVDASTLTATVTGVTGGNFEAVDYSEATTTINITDTIDTTTVSISGTDSIMEGGTATYTLSVNHAPQGDLSIVVSIAHGTTNNDDLTAQDIIVTIPNGQTSITFDISNINDTFVEGSENYIVSILSATGGNYENLQIDQTQNSVTTTILDNDINPAYAVVSEEGLTNGIADDNGTPTDSTDSATFVGAVNTSNLVLSGSQVFTFTATINDMPILTSGGESIIWTAEDTSIVGSVNGENAINITIDNNGQYTVTLSQPIDHPLNSVEDIVSFGIGINITDGNLVVNSTLNISIEDDMPTVEESSAVATVSTNIPDIFTGSVSFSGNGGNNSQYTFAAGAVLVTGKGFTSDTDLALIDSNLNQTSSGLGVVSVSAPYHNLANEVDFRKTADGQEASEELTIKLADGKIAYGAKINFAAMYGGEEEVGVAEFYRDGILVSTQVFTSDATSGNYAANFEVVAGGFDTIIIRALDNGNPYAPNGDNSDFTVSGIEFLGSDTPTPFAYAAGTINYAFGADGAGQIYLTGLADDVTLINGGTINLTTTNNAIIATDSNGNMVFQVQLTPATGQWEFYQYQKFTIGDGSEQQLDFTFKVNDADGDMVYSSIKVEISNNDVTITGIGSNDGDINVFENDLSSGTSPDNANLTQTGTFNITALDGISTLSVGSTEISFAQLSNLSSSNITVDTEHGQLTLTGFSGTSQGGTVTYSYTLDKAVDNNTQSGATNEKYIEPISINIKDIDGDESSSFININIADDMPVVHNLEISVSEIPTAKTNVMLIIDTSGSMDWSSGIVGKTRLEATQEALIELLNTYENNGVDIMVNIVTYSESASIEGNTWLAIDEAKAIINNLTAYGLTNFDDALGKAMTAFDQSGSFEDGQNVSYFFSDGAPNRGVGDDNQLTGNISNNSSGISSNEEALWKAFLNENSIVSHSIGVTSNATDSTSMNRIAWNGETQTDMDYILVEDMTELLDTIQELIVIPEAGNLLTNGGFGADGGYISSITIDGGTYTFDGTNITNPDSSILNGSIFEVTTKFGVFEVNMTTGGYSYEPNAQVLATQEHEIISFTVIDSDRDSSSATLTIDLSALMVDVPTIVSDAQNTIITNEAGVNILVNMKLHLV
jgi:hypothetical protein